MDLKTPITDHVDNGLDPYKAAPQELKDLWKSWTKRVPATPFEIVSNSTHAFPSSMKGLQKDILEAEFTEFVKNHILNIFSTNPEALENFLDGPSLSPKAEVFVGLKDLALEVSLQKISNTEIATSTKRKLQSRLQALFGTPHTCLLSHSPRNIPGLVILPNLLPPLVQQTLLDLLLHRELSNPENKTNLHFSHNLEYPPDGASFFNTSLTPSFAPKDPAEHKPLSNKTVLEKNLHWITLGGQYDWTNKVYPAETPPKFSEDLARLVGNIFADMTPEAAIVNVYSAKDKLSMHRDVSEEADQGLVSISLGCSCIFIIGIEDGSTGEVSHEILRLDSGDAVYMAGQSRHAWHGVPKIIPDTCPDFLRYWPGVAYPEWDGWMSKKRINLNIRQMYN